MVGISNFAMTSYPFHSFGTSLSKGCFAFCSSISFVDIFVSSIVVFVLLTCIFSFRLSLLFCIFFSSYIFHIIIIKIPSSIVNKVILITKRTFFVICFSSSCFLVTTFFLLYIKVRLKNLIYSYLKIKTRIVKHQLCFD